MGIKIDVLSRFGERDGVGKQVNKPPQRLSAPCTKSPGVIIGRRDRS